MAVDRFEPSVKCPVKHDISRSGERAAPDWKVIGNRPHYFGLDRVPGGKFSAVATRRVIHADIRSHIRRAGDIVWSEILFIHAGRIVGDVCQSGWGGKGGRLPVLCSG